MAWLYRHSIEQYIEALDFLANHNYCHRDIQSSIVGTKKGHIRYSVRIKSLKTFTQANRCMYEDQLHINPVFQHDISKYTLVMGTPVLCRS